MEVESASTDIEIDLTDWYNICLDRPEVFSLVYFKHIIRKPSSKFHFLLYSLIKKINRTEYSNYIAVAAPRGNAKTQIMSVVLPIWSASLEQKKFIVLISETSGVAESNLESIKHELTTNEKLANDFPHVVGEGPVWRKEMIRTNNGIQIIALGSGKQIRGRVMQEGVRPSLILCDDILSDVFVRTKAQREFLKEWFTKAVLGMAGPGDKMDTIVVGTILNPNDLLSELLDPNKSPGWEGHRFKAVYQFSKSPLWRDWEHIYIDRENPNSREDSLKFFNKNKQEMLDGTKVLWPEGDSYYSLMEYRITHGARAFASEKQSLPIDPSTTLFDNSKIVYYNRQQLIMEDLTIFGALDASSGQARKHGDLACVTTIGKHRKTGIIYVLDSWAKEAPPTDCISYMKQMHKLYRYTRFAVDSDSLKLLKSNIEHEIPDLKLTMYNLRIQKNKRFEKLEPLISNGTIQVLKAQIELLTEIDTYPKSEYDDALDSLEMAVTMSSNRSYQLRTY